MILQEQHNGIGTITCSNETEPLISMRGKPLAINYNQNKIIDLFGTNIDDQRVSWVNRNWTKTKDIIMGKFNDLLLVSIKTPHSNLFLDLNDDYLPDLMITTEEAFEIWQGICGGFKYFEKVEWPFGVVSVGSHAGQSLYLYVDLKGSLILVVPLCLDYLPELDHRIVSRRLARPEDKLYRCKKKKLWGFVPPDKWKNVIYTDAITLPTGDLNMGGYIDLLATLRPTRINGRECFCKKMLNAKFAKELVALLKSTGTR
ncbi:Similar to Itfg1: T-cell immunomodulatory protein (Mus musculus) [Cotesia congregata]|uniref:Similar to Itfg1: T-cell immunomodulatory protein (Mus musculus) n=1 Tax=Cotesia congregata TaxID=51543 RepID=A0A8J2EHG7_COTCN|nr:Similar to Itfg1: T-cell immunomodulatory protein (Mus musculus) [Cotesia congregata]